MDHIRHTQHSRCKHAHHASYTKFSALASLTTGGYAPICCSRLFLRLLLLAGYCCHLTQLSAPAVKTSVPITAIGARLDNRYSAQQVCDTSNQAWIMEAHSLMFVLCLCMSHYNSNAKVHMMSSPPRMPSYSDLL